MFSDMRARKLFYVIAYDVTDDKRRNKVVKLLSKHGVRSNYSVFECMLTESQFVKICESLRKIINPKEQDQVAYYPICVNCFTKILYEPPRKEEAKMTLVF